MKKIEVTLTAYGTKNLLKKQKSINFTPDGDSEEWALVNVFDDILFQEINGFGGALTESSGVTFKKLSPANQRKLIELCYDSEKGLGYTLARMHINSCDFSEGNYAYVEKAGDYELRTFSMARDKKNIFPLVKSAIKKTKNNLWILGSPWSPPAWMKTTGQMNRGGKLLDDCRKAWADYYVRFIRECEKNKISISALTIQNEPKATQSWDSCIYTAEEERDFMRDYLGPAIKKAGLAGKVKLFFWDHNKERVYERTCVMMEDKKAAPFVAGAAFHWYSGDHFEQLSLLRAKYPKLELMLSECCVEIARYGAGNIWAHGERYGYDIIGNLNNGMNKWIDWNVLLDSQGGPNHVGNFCNAPIRTDAGYKKLVLQPQYYYIGHFSKFIRPGAKRIGFSKYTECLDVTAAKNTDGTIAVIVMNKTESEKTFKLRYRKEVAPCVLPPHSIATYTFAAYK